MSDPLWPEGLPAHVQHPKTAAGRRLLGKNMRSGDAALVEWLANDIWAIETEAALSAVSVPTPLAVDEERLAAALRSIHYYSHDGHDEGGVCLDPVGSSNEDAAAIAAAYNAPQPVPEEPTP